MSSLMFLLPTQDSKRISPEKRLVFQDSFSRNSEFNETEERTRNSLETTEDLQNDVRAELDNEIERRLSEREDSQEQVNEEDPDRENNESSPDPTSESEENASTNNDNDLAEATELDEENPSMWSSLLSEVGTISNRIGEFTKEIKLSLIASFPFLASILDTDDLVEEVPEESMVFGEVPGSVYNLTRRACNYFQAPSELIPSMLAIMNVESGFDTNSQNDHSTALGLAQFLDSTFEDYANEYGPDMVEHGLIEEDDLFNGRNPDGSYIVNMEAKRNPLISVYLLTAMTLKNYEFLQDNGYAEQGLHTPYLTSKLYECHHDGRRGAISGLEYNRIHQDSAELDPNDARHPFWYRIQNISNEYTR